MLAALGFATLAVFLFAIMTKRLSVLVALILIPVVAGLLAGAGAGLGPMMLRGIGQVAPVGVMIIFAVLLPASGRSPSNGPGSSGSTPR